MLTHKEKDVNTRILIAIVLSFVVYTATNATTAAEPATTAGTKVFMKAIPVTPKKSIHNMYNQTVYGRKLMYNGDGTYTLYMRGEGKEWWPLLIDCGNNRFSVILLEDAPADSPISVDIGAWSSWSGKWFKPTKIHVHDLDEVGAGGWVHTSGGKSKTHTRYQVNIVE